MRGKEENEYYEVKYFETAYRNVGLYNKILQLLIRREHVCALHGVLLNHSLQDTAAGDGLGVLFQERNRIHTSLHSKSALFVKVPRDNTLYTRM